MKKNFLLILPVIACFLIAAFTSCEVEDYPYLLKSDSVIIQVIATAGPWDVGINPSYSYGTTGSTSPAVVNKSNGLSIRPGAVLKVDYESGTVNGGAGPCDGANGDTDYTVDYLNNPAKYVDESERPVYLEGLIGVFTDSGGVIKGKPFKIGNGTGILTVPDGADQLQLGFNDAMFSDDTGFLMIRITASE